MYISVTCLAFRGAAREVHQRNFFGVLQSGTRLVKCHQAKGRLGCRLEACGTSQNHCNQRCKLATTAASHEAAVWVMGRVLQPASRKPSFHVVDKLINLQLALKAFKGMCLKQGKGLGQMVFLKRPCWLLQDVMHWPLNTHSLILHTQTYTYTHTHTHKHVHTFACQSFADATGTIRRLNTQLPNLATPWYADMVAVRSTSSLTHTPGTSRRESRASSSAPQVNSFPTVNPTYSFPVSNMLPISRHVLAISRQICVISSIQSVLACYASFLKMTLQLSENGKWTLQLSENGKWKMTLQLSENGGKWGPRLRLVLQTLQ